MARASGSAFYDPEDSSNPVTFRARCRFLKTVLDNEPELAKGVSEEIFPIFSGIDPRYHTDTNNLWEIFIPLPQALYFKGVGKTYEPEGKTLYFAERRELLPPSRIVQNVKLDLAETVEALAAAYDKLKLWRFGRWTIEIFVRFAIFWNKQPAIGTLDTEVLSQELLKQNVTVASDGALSITLPHPAVTFRYAHLELKDHAVILELQPPRSLMNILEEARAKNQPPYILRELPWNDYTKRYGDILSSEERAKPLEAPLPSWIFDPDSGEYLTPIFSVEDYSPTELGSILKDTQTESRTHHLKRLEAWAKAKGLASFQGHRKRKKTQKIEITPDERYLHLYFYAGKRLSIREITDQVASSWEAQGEKEHPDPEAIKDGITALARHLQMHIKDFAERDEEAYILRGVDAEKFTPRE